jgi:SMODS and SLOG-associating 2TM effector domain 1
VGQADAIDHAVQAVGRDRPEDYVLAPTMHAEALADKAPALARLLRTAKLETLALQYERLDRQAGAAQQKFKGAMAWANRALLLTTGLGAGIMVVGILASWAEDAAQPLSVVIGLIAVLSGGMASMSLFRVREGNLLEAWMSGRAYAETARLSYFSTLMQGGDDRTSDPPLGLLKLEYFRRYQLDVQITYYTKRGHDHRQAADWTLMLGGFAVAAGAVAAGSAGVLAAIDQRWAALAAVGVIGTALAAFAATREAVNQDRRNAERYGRTLSALEILRGRLDDVRAGVLKGSQDVLEEYVAAVHEQLSLEHREWLSGAESTRSAIGKMDETLAALERDGATPKGAA